MTQPLTRGTDRAEAGSAASASGGSVAPASGGSIAPASGGSAEPVIRIAFDVTPMTGARTGVGNLVAGFYAALRQHAELHLVAYAATVRGRAAIRAELGARLAPLPARVLRQAWLHTDWPPVERWAGPIDLVHGMNYVVPPTRHGRALVSVHDLTVVRYPEMCTPDTLQYPTLLRRAFCRGAHVHVDSAFVADEVLAWSGIAPGRVHVVHPGLDPLVPGDPSRVRPAVAAVVDGRPFVLGLGTIEPRKDFPTLLRAFAAVCELDRELLLVIAGADGWGINAFDAELGRLPATIRARVTRLGYVDPNEKAVLLRVARVLAYPSVYEGFGLPPLEAMQACTPVVSSNAGSLPEVLGGGALFVNVGDEAQLAEHVLRAHMDDATRASLIRAGLARAASFGWERAGNEMASLYRSLAGSKDES
jgi:glycosyltransferase involved in cell wall biosynthesis